MRINLIFVNFGLSTLMFGLGALYDNMHWSILGGALLVSANVYSAVFFVMQFLKERERF